MKKSHKEIFFLTLLAVVFCSFVSAAFSGDMCKDRVIRQCSQSGLSCELVVVCD